MSTVLAPVATDPLNRPPASDSHVMAFDPAGGGVILFSGADFGQIFPDTWRWDGTTMTWTNLTPGLAVSPPARTGAVMVTDPVRKRIVLIGGRADDSTTLLHDVWEWDGSAWHFIPVDAPAGDYGSATFDTVRNRIVYQTQFGETWEYHGRGGGCSLDSECNTGHCTDGVCCEQASCGTCERCDTTAAPGVCTPITSMDDSDSCPVATKTCDSQSRCRFRPGQACTNGPCADDLCSVDGV
jgi:hypothetical protein